MTKNFADTFVEKVRAGEVDGFSVDPDNPAMAYETMPIDSAAGERMRFTGYGGYESQQQHARKYLTVDSVYTVEHIDVGEWSSTVEFKEFPGKQFNTVMFTPALSAADGAKP